jgi:hypothetical protein
MIKLTFFVLSFLSGIYLYSQNNFILKGKVTDSINNPACFVSINLLNYTDSSFLKNTHSDQNGAFEINNIPPGKYLIRTNSEEFETNYILLGLNNNSDIIITMKPIVTEIDEVIITGKKKLYEITPDKRIYLTENDENIQNAFASDAVENAPGVYTDIDGNLIFRGKPAELWINGKPANKIIWDIPGYLSTTPASQIERIEVITNPSAKYSATNVHVIVNIEMKKVKKDNNLLVVSVFANTLKTRGAWVSSFITKKKIDFNVFGLASYSYKPSNSSNTGYTIIENDTNFYFENTENTENTFLFLKFGSELTYRINEKISISNYVYYNYYESVYDKKSEKLRRFNQPFHLNIDSHSENINKSFYNRVTYNHKINGKQKFDIMFLPVLVIETRPEERSEKNMYSSIETRRRSEAENKYNNYQLTGNYYNSIKENLEITGGFYFKPKNEGTEKNDVDTISSSYNSWYRDNTLSKSFISNEESFEVFAALTGSLKKIKYIFGIRYEKNKFILYHTVPQYTISKLYQNLYPSIQLSYETKSGHNFSAGYSRRVDTPIRFLNPYVDRYDNDVVFFGNPNLEFAIINNFEATYFKSWEKVNVTASIYSSYVKNDITSVSYQMYDNYYHRDLVAETFANCTQNNFTGLELDITGDFFKKIHYDFFTNIYHKKISGSFMNQSIKVDNTVMNTGINLNYNISKKVTITFKPNYRSSELSFIQKEYSNYYVDASLKLNFWENRFGMDFRVNDFLNTRNKKTEYYLDNFYYYSYEDNSYQKIQLNLLYRLGNLRYSGKAKINQLSR